MESPIVKQRFRPHRSVSFPPGIMSAAMTNKNRVIAIWTPWTVVCRSSLMSLIMTFMLEPAKLQMNCARASGSSMRRSDGAIFPVSTEFAMALCPQLRLYEFEMVRDISLRSLLCLNHTERYSRSATIGEQHCQFEFDAVDSSGQSKDSRSFLIREHAGDGH